MIPCLVCGAVVAWGGGPHLDWHARHGDITTLRDELIHACPVDGSPLASFGTARYVYACGHWLLVTSLTTPQVDFCRHCHRPIQPARQAPSGWSHVGGYVQCSSVNDDSLSASMAEPT